MKSTVFTAALIFLTGLAFSQTKNLPAGEFTIVQLLTGGSLARVAEKQYTLRIDSANGLVSAKICNTHNGNYELKGKNKIKFGAMASTRMMCPDMTHEQAFIQAMADADNFVVNGSRIQIRKKKQVLMELAPNATGNASTQALPSGKWYVLSIETDNGLQQVSGSKAYLQFDLASKRVTGNGSCNSISGPLKMEATEKAKGTIELGNMISTMMACPEMNIESALLKALREVNSWEQQTQTLLLKKDGKVLVTLGKPMN